MEIGNYIPLLIAAVLAFIGGYLLHWFTYKTPNLIYYLSSLSDFIIKRAGENENAIYTHSITIVNRGNATAEKVQISHAFLPKDYKIVPDIPHTILSSQSVKIIQLQQLHPKESVQISYLYFQPYSVDTIHTSVRSKECLAKPVPVISTIMYPKWFNVILGILVVVGALTILYFIITTLLRVTAQAYFSQ